MVEIRQFQQDGSDFYTIERHSEFLSVSPYKFILPINCLVDDFNASILPIILKIFKEPANRKLTNTFKMVPTTAEGSVKVQVTFYLEVDCDRWKKELSQILSLLKFHKYDPLRTPPPINRNSFFQPPRSPHDPYLPYGPTTMPNGQLSRIFIDELTDALRATKIDPGFKPRDVVECLEYIFIWFDGRIPTPPGDEFYAPAFALIQDPELEMAYIFMCWNFFKIIFPELRSPQMSENFLEMNAMNIETTPRINRKGHLYRWQQRLIPDNKLNGYYYEYSGIAAATPSIPPPPHLFPVNGAGAATGTVGVAGASGAVAPSYRYPQPTIPPHLRYRIFGSTSFSENLIKKFEEETYKLDAFINTPIPRGDEKLQKNIWHILSTINAYWAGRLSTELVDKMRIAYNDIKLSIDTSTYSAEIQEALRTYISATEPLW